MAQKRMYSMEIVGSDAFLDMPTSARLLYYDLGMRADDDGFINSPKSIMRMTGASDDDNIIEAVTMFNPGEVLVIGDSAPIPLKIKVDLAKERPQSRTIEFWDEWKLGNQIDIKRAARKYLTT